MKFRVTVGRVGLVGLLLLGCAPVFAQSFRVQCPLSTTTHPLIDPVTKVPDPNGVPDTAIKCQQISGGDGFATMADGSQIYMFAFGPLSGLVDLRAGMPATEPAAIFNQVGDMPAILGPADAGDAVGSPEYQAAIAKTMYNGAVGLVPDPMAADPDATGNTALAAQCAATYPILATKTSPAILAPPAACLTGHVDPRAIIQVGVMNGNQPAPLMAIDEDDEFFLTLTNVGMIMRPDLFEQHTVHFHGYPNASSYYDGVPDASVAIQIGGSFTYYYMAPDAGTYFYHCHITPPEHLQMGMVGQLYVRPRQNKVATGGNLRTNLVAHNIAAARPNANTDSWNGLSCSDILCTGQTPVPAVGPSVGLKPPPIRAANVTYGYNDGDGSTGVQVEYPIQIHGFDPNFHYVGMTFNSEAFTDMKDKYFLLNGRSYPDTVASGALSTPSADGAPHFSQPLPTIINIPAGGKALLRISDLDVTEFQTLASLGIPMHVIGYNARLLRDLGGGDTSYYTNSVTLGGGESVDVILDASATDPTTNLPLYSVGQVFYLYTPNLDHLSNDAENFGGLMTEVHICNTVNPDTKACT
jgi:FtsP/CotA-like multicopper oxidase with cupredoxin domain